MEETRGRILLVDDEPALTSALSRRLTAAGANFDFFVAHTAREAVDQARLQQPHAAVVDLALDETVGPESGLRLISRLLMRDSTCRILVLTGHGEDQFGIEAVNRGAASFNSKPLPTGMLAALLADAVKCSRLERKHAAYSSRSNSFEGVPGLLTRDPAMKPVVEGVVYAARYRQPTLILGETGSGKGVVAQAIHDLSARRGPLVRFQPRHLGGDLTASELFGHERGAFTGAAGARPGLLELADGGTLFLDEVDQLPRPTQVTLLEALQSGEFRRVGSLAAKRSEFSLITASNADKTALASSACLREDFFHRIAHQIIRIPPLRLRPADVQFLAEHFLCELANRENLPVCGFGRSALAALRIHPWPGNVRELQSKTTSAAYRASYNGRRTIRAEDFEFDSAHRENRTFRAQVHAFERSLVEQALQRHDYNQSRAAASLALDRSQLRRILLRNPAR